MISKELIESHPWNVISEESYKTRIMEIFEMLADSVSKTVGPYGAGTMIEEMGSYHMSKDGFTVLKNIRFNNTTDNILLHYIQTISHQMVMKVGDGSTTAILAAHAFIEEMSKHPELTSMRPKDINILIKRYVDLLAGEIQKNAKQISDEEFVDVMGNIARIATNGDELYTSYIQEIYKTGRETAITKRLSLTDQPSYRIMDDMFWIEGRYMDKIYCNADNNNKCIVANPKILLFNYTLDNDQWCIVEAVKKYLMSHNYERVIIIAPNYDNNFIDHIKNDVNAFIDAWKQQGGSGAIPFPIVFVRNPYVRSVERYIFEDLAPFIDATIINPLSGEALVKEYTDINRRHSMFATEIQAYEATKIQRLQEIGRGVRKEDDLNLPPMPVDKSKEEFAAFSDKVIANFGTCGKVTISNSTVEFTELTEKNDSIIQIHINDAKDGLEKEKNDIENMRYITKQYIDAKERLTRIACRSAVIYVGGNSDLEKKMNDDALDDAIKACQSAATYGYNIGSNLAIFKAIESLDTAKELNIDSELATSLEDTLRDSFYNVVLKIYQNRDADTDIEVVKENIKKGLELNKCYDLNTDEFNGDIINSCRTDIEILKGAISIIGSILSSNQYISVTVNE